MLYEYQSMSTPLCAPPNHHNPSTTTTTTTTSRWTRLQRYAQWKSGCFPLSHLPHDILAHIFANFLTPLECQHVLTALIGRVPSMFNRADLVDVPEEVRAMWIQQCAYSEFHFGIGQLADLCFFHARDYSYVHVFVDWSPFASKKPPKPVATIKWQQNRRPHGSMIIHSDVLMAHLFLAIQDGRTAVQLSVYRQLQWNRKLLLHPQPVHTTCHAFLPHFFAFTKASNGASQSPRTKSLTSSSKPCSKRRSATWSSNIA